jgi:AraC-like DNA-binding protein
MGPITFVDLVANSDVILDSGEECSGYRINFVRSGRLEAVHRGSSLCGGPGTVFVYQPQGHALARWTAGSRMLALKIDSGAVDDALSDALGRRVTSQPDFAPAMSTNAALARSWMSLVSMVEEQLLCPHSLLNRPMVGLPIADSLVRGFLLAADHSLRDSIAADGRPALPRAVRAAIDILEHEAHLPITVSSLAARSHVSVRSLQASFRSHLGVSPITYLREVRLRRAHQTLLKSDPSEVTVASVAHAWGFTHLGRFAALHAERYGEAPSATLYRSTFRRSG